MGISKNCLLLLVLVSVVYAKSVSKENIEKLENEYARVMIRLGKINNKLERQKLERNFEQNHDQGLCVKNEFPCVNFNECCSEHCDFSYNNLVGICKYNKHGFKYLP